MRLLHWVKKLFGQIDYIDTIGDKYSNKDINNGYSGGSLSSSNILIATNAEIPLIVVDEILKRENSYYSVISLDKLISIKDIIDSSNDLIGPYTHIINIFYDKGDRPLLTKESLYNNNDCIYLLYEWLQKEVDYLVTMNQYATICTVFIGTSSIEGAVKKKNIEMCIKGLAEVLSNHSIICNGIISNRNIELKELLETSVFLSSRYGQIMTGEVIKFS